MALSVEIVAMFRGRFVYFVDCSRCGLCMKVTLDYARAEAAKAEHLIDHDLQRLGAGDVGFGVGG
jgi:hypothetical protein